MRFLIVKTSSLGDILHTIPAVQFLKHLHPTCEIDWVVEESCLSIVKALPFIENMICIHSKKWKKGRDFFSLKQCIRTLRQFEYDAIFDFQGNCKSAVILGFTRGLKIGFNRKTVAEWPNLLFTHLKFDPPKGKNIREDYLYLIERFFKQQCIEMQNEVLLSMTPEEESLFQETKSVLPENPILVFPGSAWVNKQLSISQLEKRLCSYSPNKIVFCWGTEEEKELCYLISKDLKGSIVLPRKLPIPVLHHLMKESSLVVAMDSLPLHLCGLTKTPTLSFFGPSLASKYGPMGNQHVTSQGSCPYNVIFEKRCPHLRTCQTGSCLKD